MIGQSGLDSATAWYLYGPARDRLWRSQKVKLDGLFARLMKSVGLEKPQLGLEALRNRVLGTWKEYHAWALASPDANISDAHIAQFEKWKGVYDELLSEVTKAARDAGLPAPAASPSAVVMQQLPEAGAGLPTVAETLNTTSKILLFGGAGILLWNLYQRTKGRK